MSRRARDARLLAGLLSEDSGVWVILRYDFGQHRYVVQWEGGPSAKVMHGYAASHADMLVELDVETLAWLRTEPQRLEQAKDVR